MRAAVEGSAGALPRYGEFREPAATDGQVLLRVRAAALSNLVKGQAGGSHYSSAAEYPFVAGFDGVGTTPEGKRVYFVGTRAPFGAMAEWTIVPHSRTIERADSLDDVTAAALGNPGLASWGALLGRARFQAGEAVLINGATGVAGQQVVQVAKRLGARRIIATGRNPEMLAKLRTLGADEVIALDQSEDALFAAMQHALRSEGVNVVVDYLWGPSAQLLLRAATGRGDPDGEPRIRYVQIGSIGGGQVALDAQWLRSSGLELMGSGLGSLSAQAIVEALTTMYRAAAEDKLQIETEAVPLSEVTSAWQRMESGKRIVFTL